jgi:hypothetical protein
MPSKKPRVVIYLNEETKADLDKWAIDERRTVNNLVNVLIEDALDKKKQVASEKEKGKE